MSKLIVSFAIITSMFAMCCLEAKSEKSLGSKVNPTIIKQETLAEHLPIGSTDINTYNHVFDDICYVVVTYCREVEDLAWGGGIFQNTHYELMIGKLDNEEFVPLFYDSLASEITENYAGDESTFVIYCGEGLSVDFGKLTRNTTTSDNLMASEARMVLIHGVFIIAGSNGWFTEFRAYELLDEDVRQINWAEGTDIDLEPAEPNPGRGQYDYEFCDSELAVWIKDPQALWHEEPFRILLFVYKLRGNELYKVFSGSSGSIYTQDTFPTSVPLDYGSERY